MATSIFFRISKKIKIFRKFSYNYVDLAHAISYVSVADDVVKWNHGDDRSSVSFRSADFFLFKVIIFKY